MSDYNPNASGRPQQGRGRGGRRRRGGNSHGNSSHSSSGGKPRGEFRPARKPEATGFQKFLSVITFGLYKPDTNPRRGTGQPLRTPREDGPVARSERENRRERREERGGERSGERREKRERRAPISAEVTGERLYVGNLSYDASESDLFELFNGSGRVKNAEVVVNNNTQRSKGFAFVTMMSVEEAKKAVADLNNKDFMGRPLVVGGAKPKPEGDDRPERGAQSQSQAQDDDDIIRPPAEDEAETEESNRVAV